MPGFPKEERLRSRSDFLRVSAHGEKVVSRNFVLLRQQSPTGTTRLGVTVSRKVGCAVKRNRVKRLLREFYRHHKELFPPADYNIIARQGAPLLAYRDVVEELTRALRRLQGS